MEDLIIEVSTHDRIVFTNYRDVERTRDVLYADSFKFQGGCVYGVIGEIGSGGWGISYLLSGKIPIEEEKVVINERTIGKGGYVDIGWYVGEDIPSKGPLKFDRSVRKQIRKGLKQSKLKMSEEEIINKFVLTPERLDCKFSYLSWESWRASVAIGFACGKRIFCFPFVDTCVLDNIITNARLINFVRELKKEGACIIIPTSHNELLELIADEQITLNNPRFHCKEFIDEFIIRINKQLESEI